MSLQALNSLDIPRTAGNTLSVGPTTKPSAVSSSPKLSPELGRRETAAAASAPAPREFLQRHFPPEPRLFQVQEGADLGQHGQGSGPPPARHSRTFGAQRAPRARPFSPFSPPFPPLPAPSSCGAPTIPKPCIFNSLQGSSHFRLTRSAVSPRGERGPFPAAGDPMDSPLPFPNLRARRTRGDPVLGRSGLGTSWGSVLGTARERAMGWESWRIQGGRDPGGSL